MIYGLLAQNKYETFNAYWYTGKAELTSYTLSQSRYGEIHQGHAVLIFVTEDFSKSKQVKLDNPNQNPKDKVNVLKLNFTKKFNTGIYPYSIMTSAFTPVNIDQKQNTLKITTSIQEWCGHVYVQMNHSFDNIKYELRSYFESEGDLSIKLPSVLMEDEIWTLIRLNPDFIPVGDVNIIPGTQFLRFAHREVDIADVNIQKLKHETQSTLILTYAKYQRTLKITYENTFPYRIQKWEETFKSGFGSNAKRMTTTAILNKQIQLDYWSKNSVNDDKYRKMLGL
jgi:hypothetical protein